MATTKADEIIKASNQAVTGKIPPHVVCTFRGSYYRAASKDVNETEFYEARVKVPISIIRESISPPVAFKRYFAKSVLGNKPGYAGVRIVELVTTEGEVPKELPLDKQLNWITDTSRLLEIAQYTTAQCPVFNEEGETVGQTEVSIDTSLYGSARELATAILRAKTEPLAFSREQDERRKAVTSADIVLSEEVALLNPLL